MYNRKHKLPTTILMICIIALLGFKDTGIFVREYISLRDAELESRFEKEETINILNEIDNVYIGEEYINYYEIPKEFQVIGYTNLTQSPNGSPIRFLNIGEVVQALDYDADYGLFRTQDGFEGYIQMDRLEEILKDSINYGISKVVQGAYDALGKPYVSGDVGVKGYDCSGLIQSIYLNSLDIKLPRRSYEQANAGTTVEKDDLIPGDLVFFNTTGKGISHVGLYVGNNNMIHASSAGRKIMITNINSNYYKQAYVTSKRIIN